MSSLLEIVTPFTLVLLALILYSLHRKRNTR